jgi:hypothetical protein
MLYRGERVIDRADQVLGIRYQDQTGEFVVVNGHRRYLSATGRPANYRGMSKAFSSAVPVIPRSEWSARLKEMQERKLLISQMQNWAPDDQDGYPICWAAGTCAAFSTARVLQGLPYVRISGMSVAVPISGGRSGGYEGDAVDYLTKNGGADVSVWPYDDPGRYDSKPEVQASRKHHLALETYECSNFDEFATAWLLRFPCTVSWNFWSHVTMGCDLVEIEPGSWGCRIRNNWGDWEAKNELGFSGYSVLRESLGPSDGFAFRQVLASAA